MVKTNGRELCRRSPTVNQGQVPSRRQHHKRISFNLRMQVGDTRCVPSTTRACASLPPTAVADTSEPLGIFQVFTHYKSGRGLSKWPHNTWCSNPLDVSGHCSEKAWLSPSLRHRSDGCHSPRLAEDRRARQDCADEVRCLILLYLNTYLLSTKVSGIVLGMNWDKTQDPLRVWPGNHGKRV